HSRSAKMGAALICALPTELAYGHSEHNENFATDQHVLCRLGVKPTELTEAARPFMSAMHPGATKLRRNELPLCAISDFMRRSKQRHIRSPHLIEMALPAVTYSPLGHIASHVSNNFCDFVRNFWPVHSHL